MQPDIASIRPKIEAAYLAWGLPGITERERTTPEEFLHLIEDIGPKLPDMDCSIVPASFDPAAAVFAAYPRPLENIWDSCVPLLRAFECAGVMLRAPLFWQAEQPLFRACKAAGSFIFVNDAANMPLGASAIATANMDAVVTSADDAREFTRYLKDQNKRSPKLWIIVHDQVKALNDIAEPFPGNGAAVAREVHIFPGVPVLIQCPALATSASSLFHARGAYLLERSSGGALITSAAHEPLPLWRYELPFALDEKGQCDCGETLHELRTI